MLMATGMERMRATLSAMPTVTAKKSTESAMVMRMLVTTSKNWNVTMSMLASTKLVVSSTMKSKASQKILPKSEMNVDAKAAGNKTVNGALTAKATVNTKVAAKERVSGTLAMKVKMSTAMKRVMEIMLPHRMMRALAWRRRKKVTVRSKRPCSSRC